MVLLRKERRILLRLSLSISHGFEVVDCIVLGWYTVLSLHLDLAVWVWFTKFGF